MAWSKCSQTLGCHEDGYAEWDLESVVVREFGRIPTWRAYMYHKKLVLHEVVPNHWLVGLKYLNIRPSSDLDLSTSRWDAPFTFTERPQGPRHWRLWSKLSHSGPLTFFWTQKGEWTDMLLPDRNSKKNYSLDESSPSALSSSKVSCPKKRQRTRKVVFDRETALGSFQGKALPA